MRRIWLMLALVGWGCQSFPSRPADKSSQPAAVSPTTAAVTPDADGVIPFTQTLRQIEKKALERSAALVAQKQEAAACTLLSELLARYPDRCDARLAYADLLLQLKQPGDARIQYNEVLETCPDDGADRLRRMLRCHSQLSEIAETQRDAYGEHFHRGVGQFVTTCLHKGVSVGGTTISNESMLAKAQRELTQAAEMRPDEAQPIWYLHCVLKAQGQKHSAERFLRLAQRNASSSHLTPEERRSLEQAVRNLRKANPQQPL